ncbi:Ascorbate-specific permease IIC component UlaA [Streptococcus sanguinis]|uniref:PTS ascorbate transporter subunit IIC n=1 Tax=Streptococcus sanguinis TaxID=1305 RepID=UPI00066B17B7|nr:PTS ascorbate transporter subunit IIC [Streptococcus sanguinis]MCY7020911.1 PTS ascorbate transporter subunit IIC [Streptococcus sanguinis]RSI20329.1 Ascorbate-specific permease IIC component UlaA [Streptococcus sanguinis]
MEGILNLIVSIVTQPAILVALIALLGLLLQKKKATDVISGTIKTIVGFLVLTGGAGILLNALEPFTAMFQQALNTQGVVPSNEAVVAIALKEYGSQSALVMLVGMIINVLLARFTRFKYLYLTGHAILYISCITAVVLISANIKSDPIIILIGGIFVGTLLTVTPAITQPFMRKITGNDKVAMGHTGNIGYASAGLIGKLFGNPKKSTEDLNIPKSFGFLRDSTVSIMLVMSIVYLALSVATGFDYVEKNLSNGSSALVFSLIQAGTFTAGFVVILQGVRMVLAEIVPAFQGIAQKLVPNSKPALDVPIIFSYAPNAVLIGFFTSFIVGVLSMFGMIALDTTVIIPGVVGHFFCGAAAGVYGNATGGRRGAILGAAFNSLLLSWLPLAILPLLGSLQMSASTFADTDYLIPGIVLGTVGKGGSALLIGFIFIFVISVIVVGKVLDKRSPQEA